MGMFIEVDVDQHKCEVSLNGCQECVRICPVDALQYQDGEIKTIPENEDECTLCYICIERCPARAVKVNELY